MKALRNPQSPNANNNNNNKLTKNVLRENSTKIIYEYRF